MIVVNTPFHAARSRRDCVGMCDALLATLKPREPIVGHATADSGPTPKAPTSPARCIGRWS